MILFPAIDILGGRCVRLRQGDYGQETVYHESPADMAKEWQRQGAEYIHVVDLDAAKSGQTENLSAIRELTEAVQVPVQVGGGVRNLDRVRTLLELGAARVIIGTAAVRDRDFLRRAVLEYGERIAVSIDSRDGFVATDGWTQASSVKALDLLMDLEKIGVQTAVSTDISRDGMLEGPSIAELARFAKASAVRIIASGGVTTEKDIMELRNKGLYGAIIGKALYEGNLSLESLLGAEQL